jgi:hypothetical protein
MTGEKKLNVVSASERLLLHLKEQAAAQSVRKDQKIANCP